jgi:hypothetical protein
VTEQDEGRAGLVGRVLAYAVLVVLTAQLTVLAAVLLLWRPFGVPVPVGVALALLVGPACWQAASLARHRLGAAGPGLVWLLIALQMMYQRREGDLFVRSDLKGLAFLLAGTLSAAVASGSWLPGTSLRRPMRRSSPRGGVAAR